MHNAIRLAKKINKNRKNVHTFKAWSSIDQRNERKYVSPNSLIGKNYIRKRRISEKSWD